MKSEYDFVVVGGGIVASYIGFQLRNTNYKILFIDKDFDQLHNTVEEKYYSNIVGYKQTGFGGLSEFWGGQIQKLSIDDLERIIRKCNIPSSRNKLEKSIDQVNSTLGLFGSDRPSSNKIISNNWLGKRRLFSRRFLASKNENFDIISGYVTSFSLLDVDCYKLNMICKRGETKSVTSKKIILCTGLMGLVDLINSISSISELTYKDHYSLSLGKVATNNQFINGIIPHFKNSKLITPRFYISSKLYSIYCKLPYQDELAALREQKKKGIIQVFNFLLKRKLSVKFKVFLFQTAFSFVFGLRLPVPNKKLEIRAFVDSTMLSELTIKNENNQLDLVGPSTNHFNSARDIIIKELEDLDFEFLSMDISENECGYHAYSLIDKDHNKASEIFSKMGITTLTTSEIDGIGDANPVYTLLILSQIYLNELLDNYESIDNRG